MTPANSKLKTLATMLFVLLGAGLVMIHAREANAEATAFAGLSGKWSGDGSIVLTKGATERMRCAATYVVGGSGDNLNLKLRCASDSCNFDLRIDLVDTGGSVLGNWSEAAQNVEDVAPTFPTAATGAPPRRFEGQLRLQASADRLDDALGFFRIAGPDRFHAGLLGEIVVPAGKDRLAHEDPVCDLHAERVLQFLNSVGLVDAGPGYINRRCAAQWYGETQDHRLEERLDLLALGEIGIPSRLLSERGERDLAAAILDKIAPIVSPPDTPSDRPPGRARR